MTSEIARMVVEAFQKKPATSGSDELTTRETQILAQLGTAPDQEIAQRLGRSVGSVKGQRVMLKIRSFPLTRESAASAGRPGIGLRRRKLSWAQPRMRLWPSG